MLLHRRDQGRELSRRRAADKISMSHVAFLLISLGPVHSPPPPAGGPVINNPGSASTLLLGSVTVTQRFIGWFYLYTEPSRA